MAAENHVQCPNCHQSIVPQLWVDARNSLEHPRVVHLCPFCGVTLRETGGGLDRRMLAFIIGTICLCIFLLGLFFITTRL